MTIQYTIWQDNDNTIQYHISAAQHIIYAQLHPHTPIGPCMCKCVRCMLHIILLALVWVCVCDSVDWYNPGHEISDLQSSSSIALNTLSAHLRIHPLTTDGHQSHWSCASEAVPFETHSIQWWAGGIFGLQSEGEFCGFLVAWHPSFSLDSGPCWQVGSGLAKFPPW